ncbi:hypothetical protein KC207_07300 [Phycicoccus sp. BSK3Z-2]|uniref:LppX_LprAFG lipoprotein n=1 Tax=Phycicoccus avicenniae TaxID=2828860 RepID=A0A941D6N6_9MICO|nr:hypothetical protein [Phycicoccus avicenniae]MBR7743094.1 hypothetical protein [Phycicoccus avicenniae]
MTRTALATLALSGALALAGCGTTTAPAGAGPAVGDTVALQEVARASVQAAGREGTAHVTASVDGDVVLDGDLDHTGEERRAAMTLTKDGATLEVVRVGATVYLGGDAVTRFSGGDPWVEVSPDGDDPASRMLGSLLERLQDGGGPKQGRAALDGVAATVTAVEDGETTYEATLTREQLAAAAGDGAAALGGLRAAVGGPGPTVPEEGVTASFTVGADGLPVALASGLDGRAVEVRWSAWGEPVEVAAPPADEVGTLRTPSAG